jgi:sigma-B regulation protein RsbU (phosphoserine phosphatase)
MKLLFENQIQVLDRVSRGDLSEMAPVATSDEFGFIAGYTNDMIAGLRHRTQLMAALKVAEEIQQTLLPKDAPYIPGVDLAGKSVYCYETGGDYFDYLHLPDGRLGVVAADASDHGVGSSLYMATVRAFLRFGARTFTSAASLLDEVNRYLTHDSADSGRFVSVFFLEVDAPARSLRWVRAGHEPGILYDPVDDRFESLNGKGAALGVMESLDFEENETSAPNPGTIVALVTDGIRETRNGDGDLFGLKRLEAAIREHSAGGAAHIRDAVLARLDAFRGKAPMEDDVTLVLLKLA